VPEVFALLNDATCETAVQREEKELTQSPSRNLILLAVVRTIVVMKIQGYR